jgi:plasmid stabilization system protein ParE
MLPITLRPEAEQDLIDARDWYDAQRRQLGREFVEQVNSVLHRIAERPGMYAVIWQDVRACQTRRFPYLVYYRVLPTRIEVLAILHGSRDPEVWRDRT